MHQYNIGALFERISIDIAGPFLESESGNRYLLIAMDYFIKSSEIFAIPGKDAYQ
jgi:hypothetical protein